MNRLILASASPRRKELLSKAGYSFQIIPASGKEQQFPGESPSELCKRLSLEKAQEVSKKHPGQVVIGSDTVVALGTEILGKPSSPAEAKKMLFALSGKTHTVWTGVAITNGKTTIRFASGSHVTFYPLSEEEIDAYIASGEPMDKAGAYAIQERGAKFVKQICGDYPTIVGLPLGRVCKILKLFRILPDHFGQSL